MKIELHMIQNFAPSCLNRDDTNSPKDCEFGGVRRARISSQCIKRAVRSCFRSGHLLDSSNLAHRTKRLHQEVTDRLVKHHKKDASEAAAAAAAAIRGMGLGLGDDGKTQYLLFLGETEVDAVVRACAGHWDALLKLKAAEDTDRADDARAAAKGKKGKKDAKSAVPADVAKALQAVLDGGKAADLALFGRMLADMPDKNIDAACQVAHAISTHRVSMEMDFYTAVDDLKPEDTAGADMMGLVGYNSACFYRYAVIDYHQLLACNNLNGDRDLGRKTVEAFLQASIQAIPTGKQNTFAAHNPPAFNLAVVRKNGFPINLANAFLKPVRASEQADLAQGSVNAMAEYWNGVHKVYGSEGLVAAICCGTTKPGEECMPTAEGYAWNDVGSVAKLIEVVVDKLAAADKEEAK